MEAVSWTAHEPGAGGIWSTGHGLPPRPQFFGEWPSTITRVTQVFVLDPDRHVVELFQWTGEDQSDAPARAPIRR